MEGKHTEYKRKINYYETDRMGIVHHSNYIRYFEEARLDMMQKAGMDYREMEGMGLFLPVTFVECKYLMPLYFGEEIVVHTRMSKYNGIKMEVSYEIYRAGTEGLCTFGVTGHGFVDRNRKPVSVKRNYPDLYAKLKRMVAARSPLDRPQ